MGLSWWATLFSSGLRKHKELDSGLLVHPGTKPPSTEEETGFDSGQEDVGRSWESVVVEDGERGLFFCFPASFSSDKMHF